MEKSESQDQSKFSLYLLLEVEKNATPQQIKKQYKKLVLLYHPDKNKEDPSARQKFQKLKEAYDILSNPEKKKQYDETGFYGDQFDTSSFEAAYQYYRSQYKKVTEDDIEEFKKEYRHGKMEEEDLLNYYRDYEGDMRQLIECIPLSENTDIPRFIKFFEEQIDAKVLPLQKNFNKTKTKVRLLKDESEEVKKIQQKEMNDLVLAIRGKQDKGDDFLSMLEQKYGGGAKKKAKVEKKQAKTSTKVAKKK